MSAHGADCVNKKPREEMEAGRALSSNACIHPVRLRELGKITKLPNIYRDYHLHAFNIDEKAITDLVITDDIIFVIEWLRRVRLFRRHGDQISPLRDDDGRLIPSYELGRIYYACYNKHNNSLLIVTKKLNPENTGYLQQIISVDIASIQAGQTPKLTPLFPEESTINKWNFDVPVCRAMIHNSEDKVFKFCDLKEYTELFTIPDLGGTSIGSYLNSLSPGNMDMVMYENKMSVSSDHRNVEGISLRIHSKLNGKLRKEFLLPQHAPYVTEFVTLCGTNTLLLQQNSLAMEVVEISSGNPPLLLKRTNTNICAACEPYYLHKRCQFICYTKSKTVHVCNLQGEILVTLEDHPPLVSAGFFPKSYVSDSQDVLISLGFRSDRLPRYGIYVSSIVTGECLLKITADAPICSKIREAALECPVEAFAYDEKTHEIFTGNFNGACVWSNRFHNDVGDVDEQQ